MPNMSLPCKRIFADLQPYCNQGFFTLKTDRRSKRCKIVMKKKMHTKKKQTGWSTGVYNSENIETISISTIIISKAVFKKLSVEI